MSELGNGEPEVPSSAVAGGASALESVAGTAEEHADSQQTVTGNDGNAEVTDTVEVEETSAVDEPENAQEAHQGPSDTTPDADDKGHDDPTEDAVTAEQERDPDPEPEPESDPVINSPARTPAEANPDASADVAPSEATPAATPMAAETHAAEAGDKTGLTSAGRASNDPRVNPSPVREVKIETARLSLFNDEPAPAVTPTPRSVARASNDPRGPGSSHSASG